LNLRDNYIALDDITVYSSAKEDPVTFIANIDEVVIDEVQKLPELLIAIKQKVDRERKNGAFLLTGSANISLNYPFWRRYFCCPHSFLLVR